MKVIIFGATGRVGSELLKQAVAEGHTVTAFVRSPEKLANITEGTIIVKGDVYDAEAVRNAVRGNDAVIFALGDGRTGKVREAGTRIIIDAMEKTGVSRLISQSSLGVGDSRETLNFFWKYLMFGVFLRAAYKDHQKQEDLIRKSSLDWTIVRPSAFTEGNLTGEYKHGALSRNDDLSLKVSLADIADFILKQLVSDEYLLKSPGLSY